MRNRRTPVLAVLAAGLMTLSALPAAAQPAAAQPSAQQHGGPQSHSAPATPSRGNDRNEYGEWNPTWGSAPPAPPSHFSKKSDWRRHVRACQQRYRSYNARTDRYTVRAHQTAICRL